MFEDLTGTESGLVAYYSFNQGVSNQENSTVNNLDDLSSVGAEGTLVGFDLDGLVSNWTNRTVADPSCCINSCKDFLFITGDLDGDYLSRFRLATDGTVPAGNQVTLGTTNSITLDPDFEVELGGLFEVFLNGCF